MARLTILQASQQGFGSTLTIHRHIKDGTLPVYEDGDTKLMDVDDLISVLGEPGIAAADTVAPAANGHVDIHEFNRIKAELEQKNKKNMWLSADLAEVVRELKEKEASFEKERNRLLTVLEQAQALLLRESGKGGQPKAASDFAGTASAAADTGAFIAAETDSTASVEPETTPDVIPAVTAEDSTDVSIEFGADLDSGETSIPAALLADSGNPVGQSLEELLPKLGIPDPNAQATDTLTGDAPDSIDTAAPASESVIDTPPAGENQAQQEVNPMMPPLDDPGAKSRKGRSVGVSTWVMLLLMIGGGFLIFEYRAKVVSSLTKLGKVLSGF